MKKHDDPRYVCRQRGFLDRIKHPCEFSSSEIDLIRQNNKDLVNDSYIDEGLYFIETLDSDIDSLRRDYGIKHPLF